MMRDPGCECSGCGSEERWLLHNIRHRGSLRHVCTSCVLKLHPGSFCPHCFEVYEGSLPPLHERVMCLKCSSVSHLACVGLENARQYVCPSCLNPSLSFFDVDASNKKSKGTNGGPVPAGGQRVIDQKLGKIFLAAARIAASSMTKAAAAARVEAERRAKKAASARKEAKEALERIAFLMAEEMDKERAKGAPASVLVMEHSMKAEGNGAVTAAVAVQKRIQNNIKTEGKDMPGGIPTPYTIIASRDKDRWAEVQSPKMVPGLPKSDVAIDDKDKYKGLSAPVVARLVENPLAVNKNDNSSNSLNLQNHVVKREEESNGVFPAYTVRGQLQYPNNHGMEEDRGKSGRLLDSDSGSKRPQSNQDALASTTNSGVLLTGSSNTAS